MQINNIILFFSSSKGQHQRIEKELAEMRELTVSGDGEKLLKKLERAKQIRDSIQA